MTSLRTFILFMVATFATGCFRWAPAHSLDEAMNASRVRVEIPNEPPVILEHPAATELRELVVNQRARLSIKKTNVWAVVLIATGTFLTSAFTALVILGVSVAGNAGG